ncbi:MAG: sulfur oxidation c-type cytochrome SoxA [Betaproteobacteria bacterium]|nr:sulfur oxidation c-type cytochrome SoxA [Betaproteobacteria bacterium]
MLLSGGRLLLVAGALAAFAPAPAWAQQSPYAEYQRMAAENAPIELYEIAGEELWKKKHGPKNASLERCDLGMGPGVLKGAYAALPRYFPDADRVMDLEARLLHCMMTLQGRSREEATRRVFGDADKASEMEVLSAYVAGHSRGMKLAPGKSHPKEKESYALGRALFFHRAGPWDFSCASCHGEEGKRIRMSELPVLTRPQYARPLMATWPAYRVSTSSFITLQWRMNDCYRQMRMPEPVFGSEMTVALIHFMTVTAEGEPYRGPAIKR